MLVYALGFDGVICDSADEWAELSWRVISGIWPGRFDHLDKEELLRKFVRARPAIQEPCEAPIVLRLIIDGRDPDAIIKNYPLTLLQWTYDNPEEEYDPPFLRHNLVERINKVRLDWLESDREGWLASHRFYPGVVEALLNTESAIFFLTAEDKLILQILLESQGVFLPPDRIFDCIRGDEKADAVVQLARTLDNDPEYRQALGGQATCQPRVAYVDDRLFTVFDVADRVKSPKPPTREFDDVGNPIVPVGEDLESRVTVFLATWGYSTTEQKQRASIQQEVKVQLLDLPDFVRNMQ